MSVEILKSYLVELGWDIKSEQLKKFGAAIGSTEAVLKRFALSLGAAGLAVERNVMKTAEQLDRLYFAAQRIGTSAFQLQQFSYAAKQIGVSGEEMQGAISAVGMAMRMPGQRDLLRGLGVQSNDAATALDQLVGRLRRMPYFIGQNFAQQFGIGPQAFYQYSTQYEEFHKKLLERQRRAQQAGIKPGDEEPFHNFMQSLRRIQDEFGLIEQKVGKALIGPMEKGVVVAQELLERFSKVDDVTAAIAATVAATFGVGGTLALGAKVLRGVLGTGGAAGMAAGGASLSGAAQALMGSAAALNEAAIALGGKGVGGLPGGGAAGGAAGRRGGFLPWLGRSFWWTLPLMLGGDTPGAGVPGGAGSPEQQRQNQQDMERYRRLHGGGKAGAGVDLQDWIFGSVMRGGMPVGREASDSLRDWLRGSASFVPRVQVIALPNSAAADAGSPASGGGIWNTIKRGAGAVGRFFTPSSAHAALPPEAAAHMNNIGLGPSSGIMPNTNEPSIRRGVEFFEKRGLTHEQAVGVVARLAMESGGGKRLDPNAVNPTSGAYGIAQWLGIRKPAAMATGGDLDKQLELVWQEFQGREARALAQIKSARTAADAARAMEAFERAGNPSFTERAAQLAGRLVGIGTAHAGENPPLPSPGERRLPPGTLYNRHGEPYSQSLLTMSPQEKANVERSMQAIRESQRNGGIWGKVDPETQRMIDDVTRTKAPLTGDKAGALVPGGMGKQSNVTIEMHNDFQVSGFDHAEVGREVVRGLGRQNADLVRNLRSAVG